MTVSTQDNEKLLQQLKTDLKKQLYQWRPTLQIQNKFLNYLIDPSFQGVKIIFPLSFENDSHRRCYKQYFLPSVEIKDSNVMIDRWLIDLPVLTVIATYINFR